LQSLAGRCGGLSGKGPTQPALAERGQKFGLVLEFVRERTGGDMRQALDTIRNEVAFSLLVTVNADDGYRGNGEQRQDRPQADLEKETS
jgi:hypothetical protein